MKVVIDAGHYQNSPNIGHNGYNEGNSMYKLALFLKEELVRHGFEVLMTRDEKTNPSLYKRGLMGKGSDLFVSLHSNAGGGKGVEVFYSVDIPTDKQLALDIATTTAFLMNTSLRGSGAKTRESEKHKGEDYYGVIDSAQDNGAKRVILIENGFHDNVEECKFLSSEHNLNKLAVAQAKVICEHLGVKYIDHIPDVTKKVEHLEEVHSKIEEYTVDWKEEAFEYLNNNEIEVNEKRFNAPMTRAEAMVLNMRTHQAIVKLIESLK
jgi:N-acetylmuramoyl-L-alanine amidase